MSDPGAARPADGAREDTLMSLRGAAPNLTGGVESVEYVRRLRAIDEERARLTNHDTPYCDCELCALVRAALSGAGDPPGAPDNELGEAYSFDVFYRTLIGEAKAFGVDVMISQALCAALTGPHHWLWSRLEAANRQADAYAERLAASRDTPDGERRAEVWALVQRWQQAHRESVAAWQAWAAACNAPGKVDAVEARMRLQSAIESVTEAEQKLAALRAAPPTTEGANG